MYECFRMFHLFSLLNSQQTFLILNDTLEAIEKKLSKTSDRRTLHLACFIYMVQLNILIQNNNSYAKFVREIEIFFEKLNSHTGF